MDAREGAQAAKPRWPPGPRPLRRDGDGRQGSVPGVVELAESLFK